MARASSEHLEKMGGQEGGLKRGGDRGKKAGNLEHIYLGVADTSSEHSAVHFSCCLQVRNSDSNVIKAKNGERLVGWGLCHGHVLLNQPRPAVRRSLHKTDEMF
jgi:hypothetical protein